MLAFNGLVCSWLPTFIVFSVFSVLLSVRNILHSDTDFYKYRIPYQWVVRPLEMNVQRGRHGWPRCRSSRTDLSTAWSTIFWSFELSRVDSSLDWESSVATLQINKLLHTAMTLLRRFLSYLLIVIGQSVFLNAIVKRP